MKLPPSIVRFCWCIKSRDSSEDDERTLLKVVDSVGCVYHGISGEEESLDEGCVNRSSTPYVLTDLHYIVEPILQPSFFLSQPSNFVFIVAADMEELSQLDQQVAALSQQLQDHGVEHVVVRSTNKWPLVRLSTHTLQKLAPLSNNDPRSVFKFLSHSFQKAAKVLTLITPGYVSYADGYTHGAVEAKTSNQKLIRKIHEELKKEFFDRKAPFRIWPVILHELKANRLHIPKFLSNCLFYNFPYQHGTDDVIELLKMDLYC